MEAFENDGHSEERAVLQYLPLPSVIHTIILGICELHRTAFFTKSRHSVSRKSIRAASETETALQGTVRQRRRRSRFVSKILSFATDRSAALLIEFSPSVWSLSLCFQGEKLEVAMKRPGRGYLLFICRLCFPLNDCSKELRYPTVIRTSPKSAEAAQHSFALARFDSLRSLPFLPSSSFKKTD